MTAKEIMTQLESLGNAQIKKILLNHGVKEPFFGVRVGDMSSSTWTVRTAKYRVP